MNTLVGKDSELKDKRNLCKKLSIDYPHRVYSKRYNTYGLIFNSRQMEDGLVEAALNAISEAGYVSRVECFNKSWQVWIGDYSPKNSGESTQ